MTPTPPGPHGNPPTVAWHKRRVDDLFDTTVHLLLVGINPGRRTAELNRHFAGPGNRFWPALRASGLVPAEQVTGPEDQHLLLGHRIGITNLATRPTATAAELNAAEIREGRLRLEGILADPRNNVRVIAVLGVTAYRTAFDAPKAVRGLQEDRPGWWVLDNPSGLNAHAQVTEVTRQLVQVGRAAGLLTESTRTG